SDGKRLWIIHPGEKEVIDDIRSQVSPEALAFLGGLGEMERDFQVTERPSGQGGKLTLTPRREDSPFKKIVLTIDPKSNLAREAELFPKNGNKSLYRFERMTVKKDASSDLFHP
ncbi:MAG: outer membrane lipoprotein carrier protein LolA, partial [Deltaproteobacteria bacterium]|nr:outer membrane lipoprotein carrier protein LolA [Deltaproteobacteria bacterium]